MAFSIDASSLSRRLCCTIRARVQNPLEVQFNFSFLLTLCFGSSGNSPVMCGRSNQSRYEKRLQVLAPGQYSVCWCRESRASSSCVPLTANVHVGQLQLLGPALAQQFVCVRGQHCLVGEIYGVGLRVGDTIRASVQCGIDAVANSSSSADGRVYNFGGVTESIFVEVRKIVLGNLKPIFCDVFSFPNLVRTPRSQFLQAHDTKF